MNSRSFQQLIKNLQLFYKCPMCGAGYKSSDIKFLGQVDNHCFMQLNCHTCSVPVLATVFLSAKSGEDLKPVNRRSSGNSNGAGSRRPSDLKPREKARFVAKGGISAAEIADFHLFLSNYQGTLTHLTKH